MGAGVMRRAVGLGVGLLLACGRADTPPPMAPPLDGSQGVLDTDSDWLCDDTERHIGSDPGLLDTDGDRLPDGIELQYGLSPLDDADPGLSRVVFLEAQPGGQTDLNLHVVVDGAGEAFSGELSAWPALDAVWATAEHYFAGAIATSADPPDHVFGFPDNGDRIGSVVGETRIGFRLRFAFNDNATASCAQAVTFGYALKRQDGARFGDQSYVLITSPDDEAITWCPARSCL
jgi:hypothetical protein